MPHAVADLEEGGHTVDHGGQGAQRNEGIHIGGAVEQGLEAHFIVFIVDIHDGQYQQELDQSEAEGVSAIVKEMREGPPHHVPHGDIKEREEKAQGDHKSALHPQQFGLYVDRGSGIRLGAALGGGERGPVARIIHRGNDGFRTLSARVILHQHGPAQQVDIDGGHARELLHCLGHMGRAGRAGHTGDIEFLFHRWLPRKSVSDHFNILPSMSTNSSIFFSRSS